MLKLSRNQDKKNYKATDMAIIMIAAAIMHKKIDKEREGNIDIRLDNGA